MATFNEISAELDRVCDQASRARDLVEQANELLDDAISLLVSALDGSVDPEAEATHAQWHHAHEYMSTGGNRPADITWQPWFD